MNVRAPWPMCVSASSSCILFGWSQFFGGDPAASTIECVRTAGETREEREVGF